MSFGLIILGLAIMAVGFLMVWKTNKWLEWFGDIGTVMGFIGATWMSWKTLGMIFMLIGFLMATGLMQLFLQVTLGRLFLVGG